MTVNGVMFGEPTVVTPTVVMYKLNKYAKTENYI
jgi:hypothetical protein